MTNLMLVALGGSIGAVLRYSIYMMCLAWFGSSFPLATLSVNVIGSAAIGAIAGSSLLPGLLDNAARNFIVIGILGSFTTYSALMLDFHTLISTRGVIMTIGYIGATVIISLLAFYGSLMLVRSL